MEDKEVKFEYNIRKRAKAGTAATFRAIVAGYIAYLGCRLIRGAEGWLFIAVGALFIAAALATCFYIWKRYRIDLEAARLPAGENENGEDEPSPPEK